MGELRERPVNGKRKKASGKSKCTTKMVESFCALTIRGLPADGVCDYLGIAPSTFWNWIQRGTRYLAGDEEPSEDAIYGEFVTEFKKATSEYRLERLDQIHLSGNKDWYKELAILERRDRKSFGRHEPSGGSFEDYDPDARFL